MLGRSCARIRVTPEPESKWRLRHVFIGDAHEITVDLATGMTLAATRSIDGAPFQDDEVTVLEIDAPVDLALTETPPGAEAVPVSQGSRTIEEIAEAAELTVLAPTWLPADYSSPVRWRLRQGRRASSVADVCAEPSASSSSSSNGPSRNRVARVTTCRNASSTVRAPC